MAGNDPWNIRIELPDGVDSTVQHTGPDGHIAPQRLVLHELLVQAASERKILSQGDDFENALFEIANKANDLPAFNELVRAGDYSPEKISAILDEIGLEHLPLHERAEQVMMVTGGAGSGKSQIVDEIAKQQPDVYQNAVQINPDDYKNILADRRTLGARHASYTHWESSMIADKIMDRLDARMAAGLPAPHVLMDITAPHSNRMEFAQRFSQMTVRHGTAPAEVTVQRVFDRGFDEAGNVIGRILPTDIALGSTANSSRLLPNVFDHPNLNFIMFNTDVPHHAPLTTVAEWDNDARRLRVFDPDRFLDFVERQNINVKAQGASELFDGADRSPQALAGSLKPYTDKGITIDLMTPDKTVAVAIGPESVRVSQPLPSVRGKNFIRDMAQAADPAPLPQGITSHFNRLSGAAPLEGFSAYFNRAASVLPHAALGLSAYSIGNRVFGFDDGYNQDIAAGGDRALYARSAFAMDIAATGSDAATISIRGLSASRVGGVSTFLNGSTGRYALSGLERAAVPLAIGAGVFETVAAVKAHDPERAAGASGCTIGGIGVGALAGAALGSETGPGAILTGIGGGIAGCVVGEKLATRYATGWTADLMGDPIDPVAAQYGGLADINHYTGTTEKGAADPASFMGRVLDRDGDGKYSMEETTNLYRKLAIIEGDQLEMKDANGDRRLTSVDAVASIRDAFIEKNNAIWSAQNDMTGLSADELRDRIIAQGTVPDPALWQGRSIAARDALKNPAFVQQNIEALEIMHTRGDADYQEPIAALRQLREIEPLSMTARTLTPTMSMQFQPVP